jgi:hypothetical protein
MATNDRFISWKRRASYLPAALAAVPKLVQVGAATAPLSFLLFYSVVHSGSAVPCS